MWQEGMEGEWIVGSGCTVAVFKAVTLRSLFEKASDQM